MTSFATLTPGVRFRLYRSDNIPVPVWAFVGNAVTLDFKRGNESDDAMQQDLDNPTNIPVRFSTIKGQIFDITCSGKSDPKLLASVEADFNTGTPGLYRIDHDLTGAAGGATNDGLCLVMNLDIAKSDNATVTFSLTLKGQGKLLRTAHA